MVALWIAIAVLGVGLFLTMDRMAECMNEVGKLRTGKAEDAGRALAHNLHSAQIDARGIDERLKLVLDRLEELQRRRDAAESS